MTETDEMMVAVIVDPAAQMYVASDIQIPHGQLRLISLISFSADTMIATMDVTETVIDAGTAP